MHHFAGLPLGARACVYLGITHQSFFLAGSQGPVKREEKRGTGVPAVPPLWPLTAPSNERRHSHTDVLTPSWSPFLPFLLPFPRCSPIFLPSVNSSCSPGNVFVSSLAPSPSLLTLSLLFHLSQDPSPTPSHTSFSPVVFSLLTPLSCSVLCMLCRKQLLNRRVYWSAWEVELLDGCMQYTQSINCFLVYSIHNVTHRRDAIINGTLELRTLQIAVISSCTPADLHTKYHLKDAHLTCHSCFW